jgi:hypothetical protein
MLLVLLLASQSCDSKWVWKTIVAGNEQGGIAAEQFFKRIAFRDVGA